MNILTTKAPYIIFAIYAIVSLFTDVYSFPNSPFFGVDFHSYWYAGHFVHQGSDPYQAAIDGASPQLPITYIDGTVVTQEPVGQPHLMKVPANTAPIVLLLSIFALLSWPNAVWVWFICNIIFAIATAIVLTNLFMNKPKTSDYLLSILLFISLFSTKSIFHTGQTSLIVGLLMFSTILLADRNRLAAGLALGIALSKYSLSLPVFLFLWLKRKRSLVIIAILTQLLGVFALAWLTQTSPVAIITAYLAMIAAHIGQPGIHLANYFPENNIIAIALIIGITIPMLFVIHYWTQQERFNLPEDQRKMLDLSVMALFNLHILLAFYHREYDAIIWVVSFFVLFLGLKNNVWDLPKSVKIMILAFLIFSVFWMTRIELLAHLLPNTIANIITTTVLMLSFVITFLLVHRTRRSSEQ
ncbi:MAG: DUF2029 domain-containing protein [Chloroflexus sp.]|nr:DUF2029 domain-containing protein [Chloroflexus sp.]